jgi:mannosyltransferase OCH1-like enzyme
MYTIPKKIHQTWYKKQIPYLVQRDINKMKKLNKEYEYHFYDDDDIIRFIKSNYSNDIYEAYSKLTVGASKADFFRYLVLYKEGGIYLDLDSAIYKNLDDLIEGRSAVISREEKSGHFLQWMLCFAKEHPLLKELIKNVKENIMKNSSKDIIYLTGPGVYTQTIDDFYGKNDLWSKEDDEINNKLKVESDKYISTTYFYGIDYKSYAKFKTEAARLSLYWEKPHWKSDYSFNTYALIILAIITIIIIVICIYKAFNLKIKS